MVCGARALRPHCNQGQLPSSENLLMPAPLHLSESKSSPGDSPGELHLELETSFAGNKGGGLEIIRRVLPTTYQSSQLRRCSGSQTSCTPSHHFQCWRENTPNHSPTSVCYLNTERSVRAPVLSASEVKTMRNPCRLMVFPI